MSADFLLELRSEEIPARMQAAARADLERLFRKALESAGLTPGAISVWSTPRRLALIARDLPLATDAVSEELKGPRTSAPPQALDGFLRKTGLTADQLTDRDGVWFALLEKPGRATAGVLAEAIPALIRAFPWPKSQRWGADSLSSESLRWVRPLSGIVALLGGEVIPCEIGGIASGCETMGHRFHHTGAIMIDGADDYAPKLRAAHVIIDHAEREQIVRDGARNAAANAGLDLVEDEGLVFENAGLTEWPVPLLGHFDPEFLAVPPEVIQLTARVNQKYFIATKNPPRPGEGDHAKHGGGAVPQAPTLANAFICTANIAATDGGEAIIAGNRKVLAARLSDARFFWEQDQKIPLAEQANKLARITFHEKLGSVLDRTERVGRNLAYIINFADGNYSNPSQELSASCLSLARECKADLVTYMVGEFPELQGVMGGYYARLEGRTDEFCNAISQHYAPQGPNDLLPDRKISYLLALSDKIEALCSFFSVGIKPTGSRDPYALRRSAVGICRILLEKNVRLNIKGVITVSITKLVDQNMVKIIDFIENSHNDIDDARENLSFNFAEKLATYKDFKFQLPSELYAPLEIASRFRENDAFENVANEIFEFLVDRLKVQQREVGIRHDIIDAVFALGNESDLVCLLNRVHALQAFVGTEDGVNLLAGYKRAANILKKETWQPEPANYTPEPVEAALRAALAEAGPQVTASIAAENFTTAMAALASLRAPIDAFFVSVTVNDADANKRANRLALLDEFRAAVHKVADFSRIEG